MEHSVQFKINIDKVPESSLIKILNPIDPSVHPRFLKERILNQELYCYWDEIGRLRFIKDPFQDKEEVSFEEFFKP